VGARHTAIVSADENGLAFYHSLGKVLFVEANDTLRILGKYPDATPDTALPSKAPDGVASSAPRINGGGPVRPILSVPARGSRGKTLPFLRWRPCRLAHPLILLRPTISFALLTPAKLVIVGLKPSPRDVVPPASREFK